MSLLLDVEVVLFSIFYLKSTNHQKILVSYWYNVYSQY